MKRNEKARAWRLRAGLTVQQLEDLTGYSRESIWMYERATPPSDGRKLSDYAWQRYRMACAAADHQIKTGETFEW